MKTKKDYNTPELQKIAKIAKEFAKKHPEPNEGIIIIMINKENNQRIAWTSLDGNQTIVLMRSMGLLAEQFTKQIVKNMDELEREKNKPEYTG